MRRAVLESGLIFGGVSMDLLVAFRWICRSYLGSLKQVYISMEPQNGGWEDEIPFQMGSPLEVFLGDV